MLVVCVVSVVVGDVAVTLVLVNVAVDALVNHLMKCKQTRCDVIPFDMTGNNNDTGVSHNLQFFIINFNIVLLSVIIITSGTTIITFAATSVTIHTTTTTATILFALAFIASVTPCVYKASHSGLN